MKQEILDRLFSKNHFHYNEKVHGRLISKIHARLLDKQAEGLLDQDEYMVQATINDFVGGQLRNTDFKARREWKHIDNAVLHCEGDEPMVLYEVKTFIKNHENAVDVTKVFKDVLKLAIKRKEYPGVKTYLIIAGRTKVIKNAFESNILNMPNKFKNPRNRSSLQYNIDYFEGLYIDNSLLEFARSLNLLTVLLRPSRWRHYDGMCSICWQID